MTGLSSGLMGAASAEEGRVLVGGGRGRGRCVTWVGVAGLLTVIFTVIFILFFFFFSSADFFAYGLV